MMDMFDIAGLLFGSNRTNQDAATVTATGAASSEDGVAGVTLDADVTPAEDVDADQTVIDLPTSPDVAEGDEVIVTLVGDGPLKTPMVTANPGSGDRMRALANSAKTIAGAAQAVAEAVNQHFFADTSGIHVTEATQDEWGQSHSGANVLINSIGQLFRDGLNNLLTLTTENGARALTIWDGLGNAAENIRAIIGETIQLGKADGYHVSIDTDSLDVMNATTTLASFGSEVSLGPTNDKHIEIGTMTNGGKGFSLNDSDGSSELEITSREFFSPWSSTPFTFNMQGGNQSIDFKTSGVEVWALGDPADSNYAKAVLKLNATIGTANQVGSFTFQTNRGSNTWSTPAGTVLWSGGWHMTSSHEATLRYNISTCPTGIVLHFQPYTSSTIRDYYHNYVFVPKVHATGISVHLCAPNFVNMGTKYLYVYDAKIVGNDDNNKSGTNSGITYNNALWVMTQVIAV